MSLVYLAGPISGCTYDQATNWREEIKEYIHESIDLLSPMRHPEYFFDSVTAEEHSTPAVMKKMKAIITRDRFDSTRCDMLVANFLGASHVSIGTMIEFGWADSNQIPVVMIMEDDDNPHDHGMVREIAGWRVNNLKDAANAINTVLVPGI